MSANKIITGQIKCEELETKFVPYVNERDYLSRNFFVDICTIL